MRNHIKNISTTGVLKTRPIPLLETLYSYLRSHPLSESEVPLSSDVVAKLGYHELMEALVDVLIHRRHQKQRAIWICGPTNTGKTTLTRYLDEIFICDRLKDGQSHFRVKMKELGVPPQVVLMDEANNVHFFRPVNISRMKQFLEGLGWPVDNKYGSVELLYENAMIVLTSNDLPFEHMPKVHSEALLQRMRLVTLEMSPHQLSEPFPFSARQLAHYLWFALDHFGRSAAEDIGQTTNKQSRNS